MLPTQRRGEALSGEDPGKQTQSRSGVSCVERPIWRRKAVTASPLDNNFVVFTRYADAEEAKALERSGTICAGGVAGNRGVAVGKSREEIESIAAEDPFVTNGLAEARVVEFRASQRAPDIDERIDAQTK